MSAWVAIDAAEMEARERFLYGEIESGRSIKGVYPPDEETLRRFTATRTGATANSGSPTS